MTDTILHVTEAYGGGVLTVIHQYIEAVPEVDHVLLVFDRPGGSRWYQYNLVRYTIRHLRPDVIHAHSSFAGLYVRLSRTYGARVVYSPHGYAWERQDLSRFKQWVLWQVERVLAHRSHVTVAVGQWEERMALSVNPVPRVRIVPHRVESHD